MKGVAQVAIRLNSCPQLLQAGDTDHITPRVKSDFCHESLHLGSLPHEAGQELEDSQQRIFEGYDCFQAILTTFES